MRKCCIGHGRPDCPRCTGAWARKPPANRYAYPGAEWRRIRSQVLERDGYICQLKYPGCLGKASQADHIRQPEAGGDNSPANLRAVCHRCHATRTGRQGALAQQRKRRRNE